MSNEDELMSQFIDITGATSDRAKFYIESSNANLELALARFFEGDQDEENEIDENNSPVPVVHEFETNQNDDEKESQGVQFMRKSAKKKSSNSNVATLFTMNKSSSDEDEEEGQAFYAGGSDRSGQQILGPPKRKTPGNDIVSDIFRSAQESGAEVIDRRHTPSSSTNSSLYAGTGYRLGETPEDNVVFPQISRPSRPQAIQRVVLKLWKQGFSIDNGEIRLYEDPVNSEFLRSIKEGKIPHELQRMAESETVDFEIEDHRNEEFKKSAVKIAAFSGKGHTLGSPAPNIIEENVSQTAASTSNNTEQEKLASNEVNVDQNQPTTMIQIRLADGSRISGRFNHTHTVDDIRRFVITSRPVYSNQSFNLLTTYPSKELTDGSATITSAGLLNAAIMQRLK